MNTSRTHHRATTALVATTIAGLALVAWAGASGAQVASALLREGDLVPPAGPGQAISALNNTAVNKVGGYAVSLNTSDGTTTISHIWGNAAGGPGAVIRSEGSFGGLTQTSFESFYGISNNGSVAYSAIATGTPVGSGDTVWKDDTPLAVDGEPVPTVPGQFWTFASRPGISATGTPYWVGGFSDTPGAATQNRGLFFDVGSTVLLQGGDVVPDLPFPLDTANTVSFDYRFSAATTHYIAEVQMETGSGTNDNAMVIDGAGLLLDGSLVREASPVPAAVGGLAGENWDNFDYTGYTEAGDWFFTGDTSGSTSADEIIVKNGVIIVREGDTVDGLVVSGSMEGAYMNESGDLAYIWDTDGGSLETLFLNDTFLLREGDEVDFDGDGVLDPGVVITAFTGTSSLTLSERDPQGEVQVYFTADVSTPLGVLEGFFCLPVSLGPTPVLLASFDTAADDGRVVLSWSTSFEVNHAGFNVYRSLDAESGYVRLNDGLVEGQSPYTFVDTDVRAGTTYYYKLGAVSRSGGEELHGPRVVTVGSPRALTMLAPNSPNPFRAETSFSFTLGAAARARVAIYDVTGRLVGTIVDANLPAGDYTYSWDGLTQAGVDRSGGVYFYRLDAGDFSQTRKMVMLPSN